MNENTFESLFQTKGFLHLLFEVPPFLYDLIKKLPKSVNKCNTELNNYLNYKIGNFSLLL